MNKQQAQQIIENTFENRFDKERFTYFVKNLLNRIEEAHFDYNIIRIPDAYKPFISRYERIGKYSDGENRIDILIVILKKETSIERAWAMQRNFIAGYLSGRYGSDKEKDAALVAFVSPEEDDWRFSLVKMDYRFEERENGKIKVKEEFTPARRYSFLVGKNEPNHTAKQQLVPLLQDDENNPTLTRLENAFNIETVTKEFFGKYHELFLWTKETIDAFVFKDNKVRADFETKAVNTVDFAKKILGQIVFFYFLQKKGWMGVKRDADWGTGPKNFLRELFEGNHGNYKNFFNDILEPLFYEALARERDDDFYSRFNCKIPFLNGGLFEPINDYNWKHADIALSNELFSNQIKTREGDIGTGIMDVFDRYNFTVKEDEPLEKEVAVGPEMLGKVFENLLEVRDRKSKGTYYTPREIVHYMCQQSLINYLTTELEGKVNKNDIEMLIKCGEQVDENKAIVEAKGRETDTYSYKLSESIRQNAKLIDDNLADIKVCDLAIGSGAFPVGMMSEIVKARKVLSIKEPDRTIYRFKRECIEKSLYGVDIDPGAVEIAKLRLWLSLVVDEENINQIKPNPLPNLDYKIMQGNSLIEDFHGISLNLKKKEKGNIKLFAEESKLDRLIEDLHYKQNALFNPTHPDDKKRLKEAVEDAIINIFHYELQRQKEPYFRELENIKEAASRFPNPKHQQEHYDDGKDKLDKKYSFDFETVENELREWTHGNKVRPFFPWKLYFANVFHNKGGFDVVIGNPPYVGHKGGHKKFFQEMKKTVLGKMFNNERMDLFYYFFHIALNNVKQKGEIAFITTNYYVTADSVVKLRTDFKSRSGIRKLVNFNELKIFDTAQGQHSMLTFLSKQYDVSFDCAVYSTKRTGLADSEMLKKILNRNDEETAYYAIKQSELYEGEMNYIRLLCGIGNNQLLINALLGKIKQQSVSLSQICDLSQGIVTGLDKISRKHIIKFLSLSDQKGAGVFVVNDKEKEIIGDSPLLKPWFKNSDIDKYNPNETNNQWIIHLNAEINIDRFRNIKKHLLKFKEVIESRNYDSGELSKAKKLNAWWALSSSRKEFDFSLPKIISPQRSHQNIFAYTEKEWVASADVYFITSKDKTLSLKYILALLNSALYFLWFYFRGKRKGDMLELYLTPLFQVPIKKIPLSQQQPFITLVSQILSLKKSNPQADTSELEAEIDRLVYELYGLTPEEIEIVEGKR